MVVFFLCSIIPFILNNLFTYNKGKSAENNIKASNENNNVKLDPVTSNISPDKNDAEALLSVTIIPK